MLKNLVAAIMAENSNFRIVKVQFNERDERTYSYFSLLEEVKEGDLVVVNGAGQAKVAIVAGVYEFDEVEISESIDYKWLIQKVDTEFHNKCVDMQRSVVQAVKRRQREQIRQNMIGEVGDEIVKLTRL